MPRAMRPRHILCLLIPALGLVPALTAATAARAADSAVILMYHRFGQDKYPSTNIRMGQFKKHLAVLKKPKYTVLPVPRILERLKSGQGVPENTVGLTIDDAYASVFKNGWPAFKEAGLPFTLFVSTDPVDEGHGDYMSWEQLKTLADSELVTIGNHTADHAHMPDESREANAEAVSRATRRLKEKLGETPEYFAYPYGEADRKAMAVVRDKGFKAAFGQHSAALWSGSNMYYLPRFALNENYGAIDRFRTVVDTVSIHPAQVTPGMPTVDENPPSFGFTVKRDGLDLANLTCFASHEGRVNRQVLGGGRVEVRLTRPFPPGRGRINCTKPAGDGRFYWFGYQFHVPGDAG